MYCLHLHRAPHRPHLLPVKPLPLFQPSTLHSSRPPSAPPPQPVSKEELEKSALEKRARKASLRKAKNTNRNRARSERRKANGGGGPGSDRGVSSAGGTQGKGVRIEAVATKQA